MNKITLAGLLLIGLLASCMHPKPVEQYVSFPDSTWYRFNKINFEVPVTTPGNKANIVFFTRCTRDFEYRVLDFNAIINNPSGEERIREFHLRARDVEGKFMGPVTGDSCYLEVVIAKNIRLTEKGTLKIELENLIPRVETRGLLGVGIRVDYLR
jgi:gliding motility-associated lipoprotein GldH